MRASAYKELADAEKSFWWHQGRNKIIAKQLSTIVKDPRSHVNILNVGAGTGGTLPTLEKFGKVTNIDTSTRAIKYLKRAGYEAKLFDGKKLPFAPSSFDIVVALDVLEHIENDKAAIKEWLNVLRPGGTLLITVPAYQWLLSNHDETNMHFRRYNRRTLRQALKDSGANDIRKLSYMIVFSLPLIVAYRMIERLRKLTIKNGVKQRPKTNFVSLPRLINNLFILFLNIEGSLQKKISFPFGTSVLAVVHKPDQ